mmetsp:Transcript_118358/g.342175  ORF Transcript_118358/g.342175 Transcript_118358/m.342175 type:complete len:218 (+) Transcript_118358:286-939(+)
MLKEGLPKRKSRLPTASDVEDGLPCNRVLHHGVRGRAGEHAALPSARCAAEQPDEALLAPRRAPTVLDLPIIDAALRAVADRQHRMVQALPARPGQHAGLVQLKVLLVRLDLDRNGLLHQRIHHRLLVVSWNILEADNRANGNANGALMLLASAWLPHVPVALLGAQGMPDREGEGLVYPTSVARVLPPIAIDKLLLAQGLQLARGDGPRTLHRAGR